MENAQGYTNNQMQRKQNNFGIKYGNGKNITEKQNGLTTWEKSYKNWKKALRRKYTSIPSEQHSKKYQIRKCQAMMAYMDSRVKNSLP